MDSAIFLNFLVKFPKMPPSPLIFRRFFSEFFHILLFSAIFGGIMGAWEPPEKILRCRSE